MAHNVTIQESKLNQIMETLTEIKQEVARLAEKVESGEPPYGPMHGGNGQTKKQWKIFKQAGFTDLLKVPQQ